MKREDRLKEVARKLVWASEEEKQAKEHREEIRNDFVRLVDEGFKGKDYMLPVKTIEVPIEFFQATKMTEEEFAESRFPGWNVEHVEKNTALGTITFIFKRDPAYLPAVIDTEDGDQTIRVTKEIAEWVPEVDWGTLNAERPDLMAKIVRQRVVFELDEEGLERILEKSPEEMATLERHMKVKKPIVKARAKRIKDDG